MADLTVKRIEVFQATQDEDNTIPLVQDKFTVARVFVDIGDVDYDRLQGISAGITGYRQGAVLPGSPIQPWNPRSFVATDPISRTHPQGALELLAAGLLAERHGVAEGQRRSPERRPGN